MTTILLALIQLLCGLYAGMALMCQIGLLPAMRRVAPSTYAETFRAVDALMDRAMPPFKLTLLLFTAATAVCLFVQRQMPLALVVSFSFACSLVALVLTITKQLPVNARLRGLPRDAEDRVLVKILDVTIRNFEVRLWFALASFAALCFGVAIWPVL